jgi:uncharacterized protein YecE (DUF72 family)
LPDVNIGTSGWSYKEWEGAFYPPNEKSKLSFYSKYFKTVEIDSTFYAYPKQGMVYGLARYTPDDFSFTAKLPKLITHDKKLDLDKGVHADLMRFLGLMKPLMDKRKLGPLLIQLPPSFTYEKDAKKLRGFLGGLPGDVSFAVEFRNRTWLRAETWDMLKKNGVANTIVDEPLLPPETKVTADFSFVRWHGRGAMPWYNYRYKEAELDPWVTKVKEVASRVKKTYGYFNNHFRGYAIENALQMLGKLGAANAEQKELLKAVSKRIDGQLKLKSDKKTAGATLLDFG